MTIFDNYNFVDYKRQSNNDFIKMLHNKIKKTDYFQDVRFLFPSYKDNTFHAMLAIISSNDDIISNSNSYITDPNSIDDDNYDKVHTVYTRMNICYNYLINNKDNDITIEEECFFLINPFNAVNFGHDMSILLDRLHYYFTNKLDTLKIPVVLPSYLKKIPRPIELIELLLPDIKIVYVDCDKVYLFKKVYITPNTFFNIKKHQYLINIITLCCIEHKGLNIDNYKNKKICLIKNSINKNIITQNTCFTAPNFLDELEKNYSYICINPEIMNMVDIVCYLYYANTIVTSIGSIIYGNGIFFNPNSKRYFLSTGALPYYDISLYIIIKTELNLDNNIKNLIISIGERIV